MSGQSIDAPARAHGNSRGILAMLGAMVCFAATDALMKVATETLPPSEVILLRGFFASSLLIGWMRLSGPLPALSMLRRRAIVQRTSFEIAFIVAYVVALSLAPFAEVFSVLQSAPILITALAALIWREPVGWRRWLAVALGFVGVAMIAKPSPKGVDPAMALAMFCALMVAGRDLTTRIIPRDTPTQAVTLASTVGMSCAGFLLAPFETWVKPTAGVWLALAAAGAAVAAGSYLVIFAYRNAEASAVSPFRYASVVFAIVLGWAIWKQTPDAWALGGMGLIVACGLYMLQRERARR